MVLPIQHLALSSGRNLDFMINGAPDGFPLLFIHGTPGSVVYIESLERECIKHNAKLITLSRAGYGGSTRNKGRSIVDAVDDIAQLLKHLKVEECVVGGWSGGGM